MVMGSSASLLLEGGELIYIQFEKEKKKEEKKKKKRKKMADEQSH